MRFEFFQPVGLFVDFAVERDGLRYEALEDIVGHGRAFFGFLFPALASRAHLSGGLRDAMALHPIFSAAVCAPDVLSPTFLEVLRRSPVTYEIL